jgi:uncharacterized protein YkwD
MKHKLISVIVSIQMVIAGGAVACSTGVKLSSKHDTPVSVSKPNQSLFDDAVLYYVNVERCKAGRTPLKSNSRLVKAASGHSSDMASLRFFSHTSKVKGKKSLKDRLKKAGAKYRTAGENISRRKLYDLAGIRFRVANSSKCQFVNAKTGKAVPRNTYKSVASNAVSSWMRSSGHKKNILNKRFRYVGSGLAVDRKGDACGDVMITQKFTG